MDENGYLKIGGRIDDIINVAGHRLSTKQIETVNQICFFLYDFFFFFFAALNFREYRKSSLLFSLNHD